MTDVITLPTRRDEAFRYTDTEALSRAWPIAAERIIVPAGKPFAHNIINIADTGDVFARHLEVVLEPNAQAAIRVLSTGGRLGRISLDVTCQANSVFDLGVVQLGGGAQTLEIVTTVRHAEPGATSRQVVRSVLTGGATGTYLGKVAVARGADGTDSVQDIKAMLLDRQSTANAVPELEIYADDVKCAHGCAIGELDPMGLFYLAARGLPPAEAKRLMLQAFIGDVLGDDKALLGAALSRLETML